MIYKKIIKIFIFSWIIYYSALFSGCGSSQIENELEEISIDELIEKINYHSQRIKSFDAEGNISIDSPELSNSGSITVSLTKPDSVYTKIEGPFGIDVADILLTRENFIFYNVLENKVFTGPSSPLNIGAILRLKVNFDDIIYGFSGTVNMENIVKENTKIKKENNRYLLETNFNNSKNVYYINAKDFYVERYIIYDVNGTIKLEINFDNHELVEDVFFPNKIAISKPQENQFVSLEYTNKTFNIKKLNYKLKIPNSAERIKWD